MNSSVVFLPLLDMAPPEPCWLPALAPRLSPAGPRGRSWAAAAALCSEMPSVWRSRPLTDPRPSTPAPSEATTSAGCWPDTALVGAGGHPPPLLLAFPLLLFVGLFLVETQTFHPRRLCFHAAVRVASGVHPLETPSWVCRSKPNLEMPALVCCSQPARGRGPGSSGPGQAECTQGYLV